MILRFSIPLFFVVLVSAGLADDARSTLRVGSDAVEPGKWIHVAAVKRGARLALYVDGEEKASATTPAEVYSEAGERRPRRQSQLHGKRAPRGEHGGLRTLREGPLP